MLVNRWQRSKYIIEKYAKDFKRNQPQTIMSITKMFINLFVGELVKNKSIDLNKKVSHYLPKLEVVTLKQKYKMF